MNDTATIELIEPDGQYKQAVLEYRDEFIANGEVIHGSGGLDHIDTFEQWMQKARNDKHPNTVEEGRVPATQFVAVRKLDGQIVGMIQVRHELNDYLLKEGGHIGYSVRKSERRKGYATQMLQDALLFCRKIGIDHVLVTCDKDNVGSAAVIVSNGGVLEDEIIDEEGAIVQRYWIALV